MAFDAGTDNDLRRGLEVRNQSLQAQMDRLTEKCGELRQNLCARERSDGSLEIDFEALAERLGLEQCLKFRAIIDERWRITGAADEKPRVRVRAA